MSASLLLSCCPAMSTMPSCCAFRPHCDQNTWPAATPVSNKISVRIRRTIEAQDRRFIVPPGLHDGGPAETGMVTQISIKSHAKRHGFGMNGGLLERSCSNTSHPLLRVDA